MKKIYCILLLVFTVSLASAQSSKTGTLSDLAFIEGHWKAKFDGKDVDGVWLAPEGDNFIGMMRMNKDGKADMYEILAYEQTDQGLASRVKHFKPGLLGLEEKDQQDRCRFLEAGKGWVNFEKEGETFLVRYEKRSADQFVIARGINKEGKWVFSDLFVFNRVK